MIKRYEDYNIVLKAFESCEKQWMKEYFVLALIQIQNVIQDFYTSLKIYDGKSLKERWDDVEIISIGGLDIDEDKGLGINRGLLVNDSKIYRIN